MTPITGTVTFEQADAGSELKITYKIENQKFVPQKTYATPEDKVKNLANVTENFQKKEVDGKIACGFHIHQFGDASNGCASAGPHCQYIYRPAGVAELRSTDRLQSCADDFMTVNPKGQAHGNVDDEERHAGDLGNIYFEKDGKSSGDITLPKESSTTLFGENSIIGVSRSAARKLGVIVEEPLTIPTAYHRSSR